MANVILLSHRIEYFSVSSFYMLESCPWRLFWCPGGSLPSSWLYSRDILTGDCFLASNEFLHYGCCKTFSRVVPSVNFDLWSCSGATAQAPHNRRGLAHCCTAAFLEPDQHNFTNTLSHRISKMIVAARQSDASQGRMLYVTIVCDTCI